MTMKHNLIGGQWTEGVRTYQNTNPSDTRDVIGDYAVASREQALEAVAAAHAAFPAWSLSTPQQRFDILDAVGNEIIARKAELGDLLNATHAAILEARRLLLLGHLDAAEAVLGESYVAPLPPTWQASRELVRSGIAMRRLRPLPRRRGCGRRRRS